MLPGRHPLTKSTCNAVCQNRGGIERRRPIRQEFRRFAGRSQPKSLALGLIALWLLPAVVSAEPVDFGRDIQPILAARCYACHGPDVAESGVALDSFDHATAKSDSGVPAIVAGDAQASELIRRVVSDDEFERMPGEGEPLSEAEVDLLRRWIDDGAEYQKHWAFEPIGRPPVPLTAGATPIDGFIDSRLGAANVEPNGPAAAAELLRRVTQDLTGLPPTAAAIDDFQSDRRPDAFRRRVDAMLADPAHGERWGRHWLDLVRYAETNSFERDGPKPNAHRYRDYVLDSFNVDRPYDQFVREQLAGDAIEVPTNDSRIATGFYRLGIWDDEPADPLQARFDELDDLVTTTSQSFLGLTINCARCHDHKIDPIPQTDYYSLLAFFADVTPYGKRSDTTGNNQVDLSPPEVVAEYDRWDAEITRIESDRREIEQLGIEKMSAPDQRATEGRGRAEILRQKLAEHLDADQTRRYAELGDGLAAAKRHRRALPDRDLTLGLARRQKIEQTFVLFRGNPASPTDPVEPDVPTIYGEEPPRVRGNRRLALARWITDPDNRLTARVYANRLWQHHFGRGIVRTPNNFGGLGTPPTHPELLDHLATQLTDHDWHAGPLHRQILFSDAYRRSAHRDESAAVADPANDLFWRFDPRRLSAEEVRDSLLSVTGRLDRAVGGPSVYPELSAEVTAGQSRPGEGWGDSSAADRHRRSVYVHVKRSLILPMMSAFDYPEPDTTCEARFETLQPGQALALVNGDFVHRLAGDLAARLPTGEADFVSAAIAQILRREATDDEIRRGVSLIGDWIDRDGLDRDLARRLLVVSVLNRNEFLFVF